MQTAKHFTFEHGLAGIRTTANSGGPQRPLGKAYRLILSYEPKKAAAEDEVGEADCQTDSALLVVG